MTSPRRLTLFVVVPCLLLVALASLASSSMDPSVNAKSHVLPPGFVYLHQYYEKVIKPKKPHLEQVRQHLRYGKNGFWEVLLDKQKNCQKFTKTFADEIVWR